jgi:hypothetical protein
MSQATPTTTLFLQLAKVSAMLTRRFDAGLGGLSLNEFIILYYLSLAPGIQLRRTDLADKVGLTASGITRLLLPMEKIGLKSRRIDRLIGHAHVDRVFVLLVDKTKCVTCDLLHPFKSLVHAWMTADKVRFPPIELRGQVWW